ncbi:MAG: response regulator [Candidatus Riflebacteria bacterium]|nr:response regulator [Candidatus Riflebacteria bacterium]
MAQETAQGGKTVAPRRWRVLVVDDSPTILGLFQLVIMPEDDPLFQIIGTAPNGTLGLEAVLQHEPDIVILDYEMPGLDGVSLIRQIKARRAKTAVFLMSSHVDEARELEESALEAGAIDFIPKPQKDYNANAVRMLIEMDLRRAKLRLE